MNEADLWETPIARAYKRIFNAVTDAIADMEAQNVGLALDCLKKAQQDAEELLIGGEASV